MSNEEILNSIIESMIKAKMFDQGTHLSELNKKQEEINVLNQELLLLKQEATATKIESTSS